MESLPAWGITRPDDDWKEGRGTYYAMRRREMREVGVRQQYRKVRVGEIKAAPVVMVDGEATILGEPWFDAWLTVAAFLALEGKFGEIKPPREWLAEKVLT